MASSIFAMSQSIAISKPLRIFISLMVYIGVAIVYWYALKDIGESGHHRNTGKIMGACK